MHKIKGNYTLWAITYIAAGILIPLLRFLWDTELVPTLLIALVPLVIFRVWFDRGRKPDERERQILLKVLSYSGVIVLVALSAFHEKLDAYWVYALWSIALITRGGFGLFFFIRE